MRRELDLSSPEWRHFVETHPDARFADLPTWRDLLARSFGLEHVAVGVDGEDWRLA